MKQAASMNAPGQLLYQYVAYNKRGEMVKGTLSATSEEAVSDILDYAGYQVVNVKRLIPFFSLGKLSLSLSQIKPTEIILFYRQLALLIETGIDIITSLELLRSQTTNRTFNKVLTEVLADVRGGNQLSTALGKHHAIFPPICCQSLKVGEQTGSLEVMLRQIADYLEKALVTSKNIKNALTMPIITAVVAVAVIGLLVTVVLPAFAGLYASLGAQLPPLTRILLGAAGWLRTYALYVALGLAVIAGLMLFYIRTKEGKYRFHKLLLTMPLLGRVNHLNELARCCRSISLLYRAGLPLTEIMPLAIQSSGNEVVTSALREVQQNMLQGEGLSQPMAKSPLFLPMMVQMVRVGEETGNLDTTLLAIAQNFEVDAEDKTRSLIGLIQPTMTIVIGLIVGLVTLSLLTAMYSIYGQAF
ncbi:MAG: type II secretion system F family protein [Chloroflexi bacterium]|nr:type II secretion system F family protein [Chloroflexota bacterium]